jgi:hypothetical protein
MQGTDDEYGSVAQLDAIVAGTPGAAERLVLARRGHVLHATDTGDVVDAVAAFVNRRAS